MRNSDLIGLTWDNVRFSDCELLIRKSLRRDEVGTHVWMRGTMETCRSRLVLLNPEMFEFLHKHQKRKCSFGLNTQKGLVSDPEESWVLILKEYIAR